GVTAADVVIVGSSLAGLVAGAILTRHGKRVVVLEHADAVGGRGGAVRRPDGYWIDFGHRGGHDVGDCQLARPHGVEAAREAGVEIALRRIDRPLRLHRFPEGGVVDGTWGPEGFLAAARDFFECPEDGLAELGHVVGQLAKADAEEQRAALPETLETWL